MKDAILVRSPSGGGWIPNGIVGGFSVVKQDAKPSPCLTDRKGYFAITRATAPAMWLLGTSPSAIADWVAAQSPKGGFRNGLYDSFEDIWGHDEWWEAPAPPDPGVSDSRPAPHPSGQLPHLEAYRRDRGPVSDRVYNAARGIAQRAVAAARTPVARPAAHSSTSASPRPSRPSASSSSAPSRPASIDMALFIRPTVIVPSEGPHTMNPVGDAAVALTSGLIGIGTPSGFGSDPVGFGTDVIGASGDFWSIMRGGGGSTRPSKGAPGAPFGPASRVNRRRGSPSE